MDVVVAVSTDLFVGSEEDPRQVVRLVLHGGAGGGTAEVSIEGDRVRTEEPLTVGPVAPGAEIRLEVPVVVEPSAVRGDALAAEAVVSEGSVTSRLAFDFVVAEPGWRMFMISHFHYDPVWWNTQAAYTETWGTAIQYRQPFQEPGLALVKAHLDTARRDPDYKFVLAELDYLKPYWASFPEDREYVRELLAAGRLEFMGGTYNEPNTNLTSAESTIRNAIYGVGYQRDVLGGSPATAWQLDAFGHDPQFPGIMADAGISSSSWARGPFHEWGPHWVRGALRMPVAEMAAGPTPRMQFETEFDWIAPSGRALLTCFMANHYSAGWWMDAAASLEEAEEQVHFLFTDLAALAATRNVLLPVGTDYSPPNKWLTAIHRDWNRRYVWPKFLPAIPREFFDAVRAERTAQGRPFMAQTRDMNPIYTGKDVSFIDTKQAQRAAENTLMNAEKFGTIAGLLGARVPVEAFDKAWRQLLFGAHHDGITGSESDQVYLDLLGGWREAQELARVALDGALDHLASQLDSSGGGTAVTVFNPLSWPRTDLARVTIERPPASGFELADDSGAAVPFLLESSRGGGDGAGSATLAFVANVPALGYRTYRLRSGVPATDGLGWRGVEGTSIENEAFSVSVEPGRGGAIVSLVDRRTGKELVQDGAAANELRACSEYPNHPHFAEGPWHLTPDGRFASSLDGMATVVAEECPIGRRIRIEGAVDGTQTTQEIVLWDGIERLECSTRLDDFDGHDTLFRVRFPIEVEGGRPVSEVGNAVVGRGFGFPDVDVARVPFTLDNPGYNWFGIGSTARLALVEPGASGESGGQRASRALGIAEVIGPAGAGQDEAVGRIAVALVRKGITSTSSRHDGHRYGILNIDSNLPDFRIAIGRPSDSAFVADLLAAAGRSYAAELERQLVESGTARLWVPQVRQAPVEPPAFTDLRGPRDLPVLVVAGADEGRTAAAIDALIDDLDDAVITVAQPAALDGSTGIAEDYTVAVLNRGIPSFNVDEGGNLHLSLMRSCSGWPSGVWIDPPRRAVPDGSNFQFQHWSHTFEYAIAAGAGDWRQAAIVRAGHEYNQPLLARGHGAHEGSLPATASILAVEPASVVLTALKPAGNPLAQGAAPATDPADGVVLRLYESSGRPTDASVRCTWPIDAAEVTNLLEEEPRPLSPDDGGVTVHLEPYEIVTLRARLRVPTPSTTGPAELAPRVELASRVEPAQPVFADYWMHNKGAAPIGYQQVTVGIRPWIVAGSGPFSLPVVVASERTDQVTAGSVVLDVPAGWRVDPPERLYSLAPGAHLAFDATVTAADDTEPGRYFVAARIRDDAGQVHEDVVTVDYVPETAAGQVGSGGPVQAAGASDVPESASRDVATSRRSPSLARAIQRAVHAADVAEPPLPLRALGGEVTAEVSPGPIRVPAGGHGELVVTLRNAARSEIRGEAQVISPHETWPAISPWTQGFAVGPGEATTVRFRVDPAAGRGGRTYWALVKVMHFGRLLYTESVAVEFTSPDAEAAGDLRPSGAQPAGAAARR